jgi:hypothetical protein
MKLYVCYGTFRYPDDHACARAYDALVRAGYTPEVERTFGCLRTDPIWPGRRKVKRLTGNYKVPTLELAEGTVIDGSDRIVEWADANPSG